MPFTPKFVDMVRNLTTSTGTGAVTLGSAVSGSTSLLLTHWHKTFGQWLIITLVVLHLAAIAFYLVKKKRNLVRPMWVGDKPLLPSVPASNDHAMTRALAAALFALCAGGVAWLVSLGG